MAGRAVVVTGGGAAAVQQQGREGTRRHHGHEHVGVREPLREGRAPASASSRGLLHPHGQALAVRTHAPAQLPAQLARDRRVGLAPGAVREEDLEAPPPREHLAAVQCRGHLRRAGAAQAQWLAQGSRDHLRHAVSS